MNRISLRPFGRWISMVCVAVTLAACGGGGGGDAGEPVAPAPNPRAADARSGSYTMLAVNGKEYTLALDFDAATYQVTGNGVEQGGTFTASGGEFRFQPGNSTGAAGTSTTRFTLADNTVVGAVGLPEGAVPFIAPRVFEDTLAGAVGRFNLLGRTLNANGSLDTTIQQGEVTADGHLRICENSPFITEIASCPAASVVSGTVTVGGGLYSAQFEAGKVLFRIAKIGSDKVFLRASPSAAGATRFMIGTPAATSFFAPGTFVGGTSEPAWDTVAIASGGGSSTFTFTVTGTAPDGVTSTRSEMATALGAVEASDTRHGLLVIITSNAGNFFALRSAEIGAVMAARNNPLAPGFIALGKRQ